MRHSVIANPDFCVCVGELDGGFGVCGRVSNAIDEPFDMAGGEQRDRRYGEGQDIKTCVLLEGGQESLLRKDKLPM
jgi:hypothetical protein